MDTNNRSDHQGSSSTFQKKQTSSNRKALENFADVETTNWNAVKLIAVKYGINLKSPEEIRDSMRTHKRTLSTQEKEQDGLNLSQTIPSEEEDLGFGTPFRILARPQADGRTVYHLTQRKEEKHGKRGKLHISTLNSNNKEKERENWDHDEAGYDPGLDSPSSSIHKQRKKHPSNRTLRVARSISAFRVLNSSGGTTTKDSRPQQGEEPLSDLSIAQSDISSSSRPDKLQRGDVLGAILGLRQGINADDYSWTEASSPIVSSTTSKLGKGKHREEQRVISQTKSSLPPSVLPSDGTWRSISPFGAPVLQRDRSASIRSDAMNRWNRSPIPRMADMGQPLFSDMNRMFINSPQPDVKSKETDENKNKKEDEDDQDSLSGVSSISGSVEQDLIFDVLQNYSQNRQSVRSTASSISSPASSSVGSPKHRRERSTNSNEPEGTSTSVLPGDDPRFALWAVRNRSEDDDALVLCSRKGEIDTQSHDSPKVSGSPWVAKRSSVKSSTSSNDITGKNIASPSPSSAKKITSEDSQHNILYPKSGAFLIAASMPYIVAELTSHIDNRFMTDFFYTYRAFTTPHELLRLLILRFRWSLKENDTAKEEAKRKIIRVRTYVVIKYWITNFFTFDFLPNKMLRTEFTDWLNSSSQDPTLLARPADLAIIKNLKKIVRNLKAAYENVGIGGLLMADATKTPRIPESNSHPEGLAEAGSDPAVNLEMGEEGFEESYDSPTVIRSPSDSAIIQKSNSVTDINHQHHHPIHTHRAPPPLPTSQGAFSRAFLNTFSRISRFTRHLNARHSINPLLNEGGIEGTSSEPKPCGDLLFVRGGLESFLDYFDLQSTNSNNRKDRHAQLSGDESQDQASDATYGVEEETPSLSSNQTRSTPASSFDFHRGSPITSNNKANFGLGIQNDDNVGIAITSEEINQFDSQPDESLPPQSNSHLSATQDLLHHFQSDQTLRSAMKEEQRPNGLRIGSRRASDSKEEEDVFTTQNRFPLQNNNIVQIDDIDLSSDEEDGMVRKALRRLPGARDLRMAQNVTQLEAPIRQSFESISSLGRVYGGAESRRSLASYYGNDNESNGVLASSETGSEKDIQHLTSVVFSEMLDPDEALRGYELVKGFRLEHLEESDEEESGDVEAALRRLEGVIDEDKQRERARKVERMWERSQAEKREDQVRKAEDLPKTSSLLRSYEAAAATDLPSDTSSLSVLQKDRQSIDSIVAKAAQQNVKKSGHSRHPSSVSTAHDAMRARMAAETPLPTPRRTKVSTLPIHRSFLLDYRSDIIAQQFSLIEMELFRAVAWQELVTGQWKVRNHHGQVLDWEAFYQARARNRVDMQNQTSNDSNNNHHQLESSIEAITARFNLTCNWVASEIVMTNTLEARAAVVRKLIRIAWKCYHQSNFATLTQIILGLQSPWIERLGKTWSRVGALEMRMLRDLKAFINPARNFKHLRNAMREMIVDGQMEDLITSTGPPQNHSMKLGMGSTTNATTSTSSSAETNKNGSRFTNGIAMNDGCIPFFGLFLSDLAVHDALPTLVEPSLPDADVNFDTNTGHLNKLADPNAFDHLPQLPKQIKLSPLINLYKYRILAMTVKTVLAFQDRLDAFNFKADKDAYVKALKLRCLEAEQLTVISHVAEP